jgi:hypothetical protein
LPRAPFVECLTLGKLVFAEWGPVPSVQHSVKGLFAESLTLPSAALGKAVFAECPTKGTRQRIQHSAKPRIPVVIRVMSSPSTFSHLPIQNQRLSARILMEDHHLSPQHSCARYSSTPLIISWFIRLLVSVSRISTKPIIFFKKNM